MHETMTNAKKNVREGIVQMLENLSLDELALVYEVAYLADMGAFFKDSRDGSRERPFILNDQAIDNANTWYWYYAGKIARWDGIDPAGDIMNLSWWKLQDDLLCKWYDHPRGFTVSDIVEDYRTKRDNAYARFPEAIKEEA